MILIVLSNDLVVCSALGTCDRRGAFCEDSSPYKCHGANSRYRDLSEAFTDLRARNSKGEHIKNWACEDVHGVLVVVTLVSKKQTLGGSCVYGSFMNHDQD